MKTTALPSALRPLSSDLSFQHFRFQLFSMLPSVLRVLLLVLLLTLPAAVQAQWNYTTVGGAITITGYTGPGGAVSIPDTIESLPVTSIGSCAFYNCTSLTSVTIPNSVTRVGDWAFTDCTGLTNVTIGNSTTSIGTSAFQACTSLTSVTIPSSVAGIGLNAFQNCTNLTGVYFRGNAPSVGSSVFTGDNSTTVYYLPGTTGWESTYCSRPTALWNPQPQTSGDSFGVGPNGFGFNITGTTNIPIVVDAATNLAAPAWTPLQSCTLTNGSIYFSDPQWTNHPARFYRLRSP
jgi:hypothetical protein